MKILIVDDEAIVLKSCRAVLAAEECEVLLAESVAEALAIIETQPLGLLLIDVKMPMPDGLDLMRRVREKWPGIPAIIMSGYPTDETVAAAKALGAAAFIAKPFTPDELVDTVKMVIQTTEKEKRHGEEKGSGD